MMNDKKELKPAETTEKKPDEKGGFFFSTSVKITDLTENKVILQKRGN